MAAWIAAGEVVVRGRLAPGGIVGDRGAAAARNPWDRRAGRAVAPLPVEIGDRVDVIATVDTTSVTVAEDATRRRRRPTTAVTVAVDATTPHASRWRSPRRTVTLVLSGAR